MVKFVINVEKYIIAVGGELHSDVEAELLNSGSEQDNLWGANFYPYKDGAKRLEYTSLINILSRQGNGGMEIENPGVKKVVKELAERLLLADNEDLAKNLKNRFDNFALYQQIIMVCNELNRAGNLMDDPAEYKLCIEWALELLDFSIQTKICDGRYKEILRSRDLIAKAYLMGPVKTFHLQKMLLTLNSEGFKALNKG